MRESNISMAKEKFLEKLKTTSTPFDQFVSKAYLNDPLSIVSNRSYVLDKVIETLTSGEKYRIIPITGKIGQGKTFICWQIKKCLKIKEFSVFMEISRDPSLFYYDIYTKIIDTVGAEVMREISVKIADRWGANEKKYGLWRISDSQKVYDNALDSIRYRWSRHKPELNDCIKAIIAHVMDPEKSYLAERYLLGEIMDPEELFFLGVQQNLSGLYMAEEMLKLFLSYFQPGIILIYDDIDFNWSRLKSNVDWEEDWTNEMENEFSYTKNVDNTEISLFTLIQSLIFATDNLDIVFTMNNSNYHELINHFPKEFQTLIRDPIPILNFSTKDAKEFYKMALQQFFDQFDILQLNSQNEFYPLSEKLILKIFSYIYGNPRQFIRQLQYIFDLIATKNVSLEFLEKHYPNLENLLGMSNL
ncbi:MAG: hypothetical protein ACTSWL_00380 [Promethearchaeota archaeon]